MKNQIKVALATLLIACTTTVVAAVPLLVQLSSESVHVANMATSDGVQNCLKQLSDKYHLSVSISSIRSLENSTFYFDMDLIEGGDMMVGEATIKVSQAPYSDWIGVAYQCEIIKDRVY